MKAIVAVICIVFVLSGCTSYHDATAPRATRLSSSPQLLQTLQAIYPETSEQRNAAQFLVENLPLADVQAMSVRDLKDNIDYAFLARQTMPWPVPWDIFLHYVLPHRTSQEPFQTNRSMLYHELAPLCTNATSMEEALSRVSIWCLERSEYRPTSRRDLGALSVLRGGFGRCEEQNILFMAAARAVGLPVRQATVPWWPQADGNHAWVEAWTKDGWRYLETSAPFRHLGATWFTAQTPRMPKVAAYAYGHPGDPQIYRTGPGFALADSTPAYTKATRVQIYVQGAAPPQDIYLSVPCMGGLRPVTKVLSDAHGQANTVLGPGIFLATCRAENGLTWTLIDTNNQTEVTATLQGAAPSPLPAVLRNEFPAALADTTPPLTDLDAACASKRKTRTQRWLELEQALPQELREYFHAGDALPGWIQMLADTAEPQRSSLVQLMLQLDDKDQLDCDPHSLPQNLALAAFARQGTGGMHAYSDENFVSWVLQPRLYLEPWSDWRRELWPWLQGHTDKNLDGKLRLVQSRLQKLHHLERGIFGPMLTPGQILATNTTTSDAEKSIFVTAALRTLGIPARYQHELGGVEYFDGWNWHLLPTEPQKSAAKGNLVLQCTAGLEPFRDFGLSRSSEGYLKSLDDLDWEQNGTNFSCTLSPGEYYLIRIGRDTNQAWAALTPFAVEQNSTSTLKLEAAWNQTNPLR